MVEVQGGRQQNPQLLKHPFRSQGISESHVARSYFVQIGKRLAEKKVPQLSALHPR